MVLRILEYLENKTAADYERTVEECSCRMMDLETKRKTAWGDYLFRGKNIAGLRKMYLLKRSQPLVLQKIWQRDLQVYSRCMSQKLDANDSRREKYDDSIHVNYI